MKMKAGVLTVCGAPRPFAKSKPIHVLEVDLDPPGEGEVLVKVGGGGLCHSDLSLINGDRPRPVPIVLGHEGAGEIVEVGAGVHDVKKGDHVCFTFNVSCGRCRRCLEGRPYICERSVSPRAAGQLLSGHHRLHLRRQAGEPSVRRVVLRRVRRRRSRLDRGDRPDPAARPGGAVRLRRRHRRRRGDQHRARSSPAARSPSSAWAASA